MPAPEGATELAEPSIPTFPLPEEADTVLGPQAASTAADWPAEADVEKVRVPVVEGMLHTATVTRARFAKRTFCFEKRGRVIDLLTIEAELEDYIRGGSHVVTQTGEAPYRSRQFLTAA